MRDTLKDSIIDLLKQTTAVTLCLDIWTSKATRGYLGLTAHFVDVKGNIRNVVLGVFRFKGQHTAEAILEITTEVITEFELRSKVKFIITDNAANTLKAFRDFLPCDFGDDLSGKLNY